MKPYNERLQMIDDAIIAKRGKWDSFFDYLLISTEHNKVKGKGAYTEVSTLEKAKAAYPYWEFVCSKEEYLQRAKELGWVNGYRWGVIYKNENHGKDLPVDLEISITLPNWFGPGSVWLTGCNPTNLQDSPAYYFKITDERYKPRGDLWVELTLSEEATSALKELTDYIADKACCTPASDKQEKCNDWHKKGELPPVGAVVDVVGDVQYGAGETNCEVVAHVENCAVIRMSYGLGCFEPRVLKPSHSETDKLQQDILDHWNNKGEDCPIPEWELANHLYSLGYRKVKPMSEQEFMERCVDICDHSDSRLYRAGCRFIDQED